MDSDINFYRFYDNDKYNEMNHHVLKKGDKWTVMTEGKSRGHLFNTKGQALAYAYKVSMKNNSCPKHHKHRRADHHHRPQKIDRDPGAEAHNQRRHPARSDANQKAVMRDAVGPRKTERHQRRCSRKNKTEKPVFIVGHGDAQIISLLIFPPLTDSLALARRKKENGIQSAPSCSQPIVCPILL